MDTVLPVKEEHVDPIPAASGLPSFIDLLSDSDSDDSSSSDDDQIGASGAKRRRIDEVSGALPVGFLDPLPTAPLPLAVTPVAESRPVAVVGSCKQFWKAGDYDGSSGGDWGSSSGGMDRVRVHPKFLHSNATSHKWVFGAFAELLDNSLDEVCNGATFAKIDMVKNNKDGNRMLLVEDNGGGMDPEKMRHCMSLGYSAKSKIANTIGQYGNGFKTSTMRLGADVIVFSRCRGENGKRPTQSIGLLSYTFLRSTGKEDIVVPMLDYERVEREWKGTVRTSANDWKSNMETIVQWSPFSSEEELLRQFTQMKDRGTRIFIYNLWEDDEGQLELDFDADPYDIQIRGVNRDERNIQMAKQYPNSKHFLTYRHSLRSYASILYLRIPPGFRIILRGKDVEHHNIVNDMMMSQEITYRPNTASEGVQKDSNMVATVTIGFVKDAKYHIDVQGFNVYHKNRLIKPFWRIWNAAGSDGRGVIGVLEANFVEPAHDKQGFERTIVLSRLESKLVSMQKTYWTTHCHEIGYAPRRNKKQHNAEQESSPENSPRRISQAKSQNTQSITRTKFPPSEKFRPYQLRGKRRSEPEKYMNGRVNNGGEKATRIPAKSGRGPVSSEPSSTSIEDASDDDMAIPMPGRSEKFSPASKSSQNLGCKEGAQDCASNGKAAQNSASSQLKGDNCIGDQLSPSNSNSPALDQLKEENRQLRERLAKKEEEPLGELLRDLQNEKEKSKYLQSRLDEATLKIEELNKEQESLIDIFSEERQRRDHEEETLRKKLKDASNTIQELLDKVKVMEKMKHTTSKLRL